MIKLKIISNKLFNKMDVNLQLLIQGGLKKKEAIEMLEAAKILITLRFPIDWDSGDEEDDLCNMLGPGIRYKQFR
tara:strand:- start:203 stop:427 length:225 start_codon:yes stop_codon:yes gene_type:complete